MKNRLKRSCCLLFVVMFFISMITFNVMAEEIIPANDIDVGQENSSVNNAETGLFSGDPITQLGNNVISNSISDDGSLVNENIQVSDDQLQTSMYMSEFQGKLDQFRARYPNGSYYDEAFGNSTGLAWQCHGYGRLLTQHVFGVECMNGTAPGWTRLYDINQVSPGDMIRYLNEGHTVFVTGVSGNIVTYTEANFWPKNYGTDYVRWDVQAPKSYFTGLSYIAHYSANPVVTSPPVPVDTTPPNISNIRIADVNAEGFTVLCTVTDNVGVTRVNYATWTDANGQDELNFVDGGISGSESSFRVRYSDHKNERGSYKVDIRAYDAVGNCAGPITTGTTIDATPPAVTDVEILDQTPLGYTIKCKVSDESGIDRVQFPSWTTANNQDDIQSKWWNNPVASGKIEGDTVTFRVNDSDHYFERGEYNTHIYAYDKFGNYTCVPLVTTVENNGNIIAEETIKNHRYLLYDDAMTWPQAEAKAEELGGTLVTISSQEEQNLIEKLMSLGGRGRYFIGATDEGQEGTFRWVTGEPFGLAKWGAGEPNNAGSSENYLEIHKNGYWNDIPGTYVGVGQIVEIDLAALHITSFMADPVAGQYMNGSTKLTAEINGGKAPYQYKFYYKQGDAITVIQDYSESNTAVFKPTVAGTGTIFVEVKDSEDRTTTKSIPNYVIQKNIGCTYRTHVQNIGWQDVKSNGDTSGTLGKSYRLEGIEINLDKQGYDVGVAYSTHVENLGWQELKNDGDMSGTSEKGLRLEAITIKLTGADADKFDIYYQVHAQNFGWLDWAKNGENAGTAGFGNRLEAINILVVPKGAAAPGVTDRPFVSNN